MTNQKSKATILLVDDESEIRDIMGILVSSLGCDFLEAGDGEEALEVLKKEHVDVIISDIMMPRMSGMTLLKILREEGNSDPFIFVTAYPSKDTTVQALRLGAFDFIEKPFDAEEIKQVVEEAIRVAKEQERLESRVASEGGEIGQVEVEKQILKMRALRYSESDPLSSDSEEHGSQENRLIDIFVTEATPQLVFCEASVKGLLDQNSRVWELGYLFRVMQTIRKSAEMLSLERLVKITRNAENTFTFLRVRPSLLRDSHQKVLEQVVVAVRTLVSTLGTKYEVERSVGEAEESLRKIMVELNVTQDSEAA